MKQSCIDICRSTLKTKQHSMIDVIGGLELSRQVYLAHFDGSFSELLPELLPELDAGELAAVDAVRQDAPGLLPLLDRLLELFGRWPAARSL
jgi:hypothetical protein